MYADRANRTPDGACDHAVGKTLMRRIRFRDGIGNRGRVNRTVFVSPYGREWANDLRTRPEIKRRNPGTRSAQLTDSRDARIPFFGRRQQTFG